MSQQNIDLRTLVSQNQTANFTVNSRVTTYNTQKCLGKVNGLQRLPMIVKNPAVMSASNNNKIQKIDIVPQKSETQKLSSQPTVTDFSIVNKAKQPKLSKAKNILPVNRNTGTLKSQPRQNAFAQMKLGSWKINAFNLPGAAGRREMALNNHKNESSNDEMPSDSLTELQMMAQLLENQADQEAGEDLKIGQMNIKQLEQLSYTDQLKELQELQANTKVEMEDILPEDLEHIDNFFDYVLALPDNIITTAQKILVMNSAKNGDLQNKQDYLFYATNFAKTQFQQLMDLYSKLQIQKAETIDQKTMKLLQQAEAQNEYMSSDKAMNLVTFDEVKHNKKAYVQFKNAEGIITDKPVKVGLMGDTKVDRQSYQYFTKYCESFMNFLFRKKAHEDVDLGLDSF